MRDSEINDMIIALFRALTDEEKDEVIRFIKKKGEKQNEED